jgi:hypothetical protein
MGSAMSLQIQTQLNSSIGGLLRIRLEGLWGDVRIVLRHALMVSLYLPSVLLAHEIDIGARDHLRSAYENYRKLRIQGNPASVEAVLKFNWSAEKGAAFDQDLLQRELGDRRAGVKLLREDVAAIDYHSESPRLVAFVRVVSVYSHPMRRKKPVSFRRTIHAFSEDDGANWKFNALGCFSEETLRLWFPLYQGHPKFDWPTQKDPA